MAYRMVTLNKALRFGIETISVMSISVVVDAYFTGKMVTLDLIIQWTLAGVFFTYVMGRFFPGFYKGSENTNRTDINSSG